MLPSIDESLPGDKGMGPIDGMSKGKKAIAIHGAITLGDVF